MDFMEIKSVTNQVQNNYPTMEEMSHDKIKKNIPDNWKKIGLTSGLVFISINILRTVSMAVDPNSLDGFTEFATSGVTVAVHRVTILGAISSITQIISTICVLICLINIIYTQLRNKIKKEQKKVKNSIKILLTISIVILVISIILLQCNEICNYTVY